MTQRVITIVPDATLVSRSARSNSVCSSESDSPHAPELCLNESTCSCLAVELSPTSYRETRVDKYNLLRDGMARLSSGYHPYGQQGGGDGRGGGDECAGGAVNLARRSPAEGDDRLCSLRIVNRRLHSVHHPVTPWILLGIESVKHQGDSAVGESTVMVNVADPQLENSCSSPMAIYSGYIGSGW
ncbi:hypothetical protein Tco_1211442 [Tanacetum coccineum]